MIQLATETQDLIAQRARLEGTSPDALVRRAIAALPSPSAQVRPDTVSLAEVLARFDGLERSPDLRSVRAILDEAWSS